MNQTDSKYLIIIKHDMEISARAHDQEPLSPQLGVRVNIILTSSETGGIIYHKTEFK